MTITKEGKKATSRLLDYRNDQKSKREQSEKERKHEEYRNKTVQQLRKAANEKKAEIRDMVRQSLSRERGKILKGLGADSRQS